MNLYIYIIIETWGTVIKIILILFEFHSLGTWLWHCCCGWCGDVNGKLNKKALVFSTYYNPKDKAHTKLSKKIKKQQTRWLFQLDTSSFFSFFPSLFVHY
jgi:hypothetical protein